MEAMTTWLAQPSADALRAALQRHAPELAEAAIDVLAWTPQSNPRWWGASAIVGADFVAKFAWSKPRAELVWREAQILEALGPRASQLRLPEIVVSANDPVLLVTRRVVGDPLTIEFVAGSDRETIAQLGPELGAFLCALHRPDTQSTLRRAGVDLFDEPPQPQASTDALRARMAPWIRAEQLRVVSGWCDWADDVLREPQEGVFVHGDFHGHNQVWNLDRPHLGVVVDLDNSGIAEREFDFRYLPGQGPNVDLLLATVADYDDRSGSRLDLERIMAWHLRTALGDALWRSEADVALPDGRTPPEWVDDLGVRLDHLGMGP
jgi:aminoglycoside phosphotransferase (APT) family kinase protein